MRLAWLEVSDFRSYRQMRWAPDPRINVVVGRNASGKTNLLEAVGYLASLKSFRGIPDAALIRRDAERSVLRGEVVKPDRTTRIEVELARAGRRRAQVNGTRLARLADLVGEVRTITFLPDDLDLIKRGPSHRRGLLDSVAVQLWPGAYRDQLEYERALRQRNVLLKQMGRRTDPITLDVWDERLGRAGARVMARRQAVMSAIEERSGSAYRELAGDATRVRIDYRSGWGAATAGDQPGWEEALREALRKARPADLERRVSTVGLHRDDVRLLLDDRDSRVQASQGEQRTLTLALRLASHRAVEQAVGRAPLLLLDDIFSELDEERSAALARSLPAAQTFISTARDEEVPLPAGRRWRLKEGILG